METEMYFRSDVSLYLCRGNWFRQVWMVRSGTILATKSFYNDVKKAKKIDKEEHT